ncbi:MAG: hypothetical protein JNL11_13170 [Bdellovibrionaceae bacterium]|nr:hypothetical protein [Pseudobdellovibrionaceae bacterium]
MKSSLLLFWIAIVLPWSAFSQQKAVNITTFNLKWFGIGGNPNASQKEFRIQTVKTFINTYLNQTHLFVFEEVVVVEDLIPLLPAGWQCISYNHDQPLHQKVVLCGSPAIKLTKVSYDDNYTIEEAQAGNPNLRPAMRVDVLEARTNKNLFTLIGVHLKAMPEQTNLRLQQAVAISKDLARLPQGRPVVLTGDFNTFLKSETKLPEDDMDLVLKALNSVSKGFVRVPHQPNTYTFRNPEFRNQFDQFYVRGTMRVAAIPNVFPVCSAAQNGTGYMNFEFYYKNVSDHCPVTMQIVVQ